MRTRFRKPLLYPLSYGGAAAHDSGVWGGLRHRRGSVWAVEVDHVAGLDRADDAVVTGAADEDVPFAPLVVTYLSLPGPP
jgi:hypothetical protein